MFGLSFEKIVLIGIIAAIIIGPSRLPAYAQKLGETVRLLRTQIDTARDRAAESVGVDDWHTLDPRQYDPRRIVREALVEPVSDSHRESLAQSGGSEPVNENHESQLAGSATAASDGEGTIAEAAGRYVITGSSGHPRRLFVARTAESRGSDEESS